MPSIDIAELFVDGIFIAEHRAESSNFSLERAQNSSSPKKLSVISACLKTSLVTRSNQVTPVIPCVVRKNRASANIKYGYLLNSQALLITVERTIFETID